MSDLSYFNLGFRSENILEELSRAEQGGRTNDSIINDALSILSDCVRIESKNGMSSNLSFKSGYDLSSLVPLIFDIFPEENDTKAIIKELKDILSSIEHLLTGGTLDPEKLNPTKDFFSSLSQLCLSRLSSMSNQNTMVAI